MKILIAIALLIMLFAQIGRGPRAARSAPEARRDGPDWIDELELFDAATDDFV